MNDQVQEVKEKVDIVSVIGERIELKKAGRNYKAACPFHSEKTASFMVSPELQIFKCFGCGEGGDVFNFLEKFEGMDFPEALKYLANRVGVKLAPRQGGDAKEKLFEITREALRFYNYLLLTHPLGKKALEYLTKDRGLNLDTIKEFKLGYSPADSASFRNHLLDKKKFSPQDLDKAGLTVGYGGQIADRLRGRVIFPLFDHRGNVVGFAGRILPGENPDLAKYVNSPETILYHKGDILYGLNLTRQAIKNKKVAIVVEGELDAISSWQIGIKNTVAIKGSALTENQVKLLSRFCQKLILALDSDIAGNAAARRGIEVAFGQGLEVKVARLEGFKDPDEAAKRGPDAYKKSLISAVNVWDFMLDSVFAKYDAESGAGKARISREVAPILKSITDSIVLSHYTGLVAKRLGVMPDAVMAQTEKENESLLEKKTETALMEKPPEKGRRQLLEERLLSLGFQTDPAILLKEKLAGFLTTPLAKRILEEYKKFLDKNRAFSPTAFAESLPSELFPGFAEMLLKDMEEITQSPDSLHKEIDLIVYELEILNARRRLESVGADIRKFEEEKDSENLEKAQIEFGKLSARLAELEENDKGSIIIQES